MILGLAKLVDELHLLTGIKRGPGQYLFKGFHIHGTRTGKGSQQTAIVKQQHS
jgi:hypothetical protein